MATASSGDEDVVVDVVVVGAGTSGLCSAYEILKAQKDCKVVVLEAKGRVGGRLDTKELKTATGTDNWDLGGQWIGRTQLDILDLMTELGLEKFDQWYEGDKLVHLSSGGIKRYSGAYPSISYFSLLDIHRLSKKFEKMCKEVPLEDPHLCQYAEEWDGETVESWVRKNGWTKACREMMEVAVGVVFGATCSQLSLLYFLHYVNSSGGWRVLIESGMKGSAQEFKIKGGAFQIPVILAEKVGMDKVRLNQPVTMIKQDEDKIHIQTRNGTTYTAKAAIIAIPPTQANKIEFSPPLPYMQRRILDSMCPSNLTKFIATYSTAFWREEGLSGEICHSSDSHCCERQPVGFAIDGASSSGSPAIVGFVTSYAATRFTNKTEEEKKDIIINCLSKYIGTKALEPLDFVVRDWSSVEWNGGCPVDVMGPGAITNYGDCMRQPFERVYWAGTETSPVWKGYISGAVNAGRRAAKEVLELLYS
ncbi:probable flavin-containing monoamine oxidase A isoform X1 [Nematostella vectensis]|uniref:probable flavin-containing monoamine oxidase A isoform X1 n=1 Tax=Nematostella vectensis TaxID=45351 RepID=UPI00138FB236|nr:probable flavin-containing monoamine oxidase A isoform X1 [Nematostella vectensis]